MDEPLIELWVEYYARKGWKLFPVHGASIAHGCTCGDPQCRNPGKHPSNANGFKGATDAEFVLSEWFAKGDRNIGLATGSASGVFVLDVDGPEGEAALKELQAEHGRLPETKVSSTGRGRHIFFDMPGGLKIQNSTSKLGPKLDIRGDGGYVILPPSHHASGAQYRWRDDKIAVVAAPAWLIERVTEKRQAETVTQAEWIVPADDQTSTRIADALQWISPDCSYDEWLRVGMAIHAMGGNFDLWDQWSSAGEKYNAKEMASKWASFSGRGVAEGTLWQVAESYGWSGSYGVALDPTPTPLVRAATTREPEADHPHIPGEEPRLSLSPASLPGMIGETVSWILQGSIKPQPEVALMAVLGAAAAVAGRKYESTKYRTRTNLYLCSIAPSGSGKDAPRKAISELFVDAGLDERHLGPQQFVSSIGLLNSLVKQPSQIMLVDEIGTVLSGISGSKAANYEVKLRTLLLELFSSSGGRVTSGSYADAKREPVIVDYPALSVYGSTTQRTYAEGLSMHMVESGEINRWVVLPSSVGMPKPNFDACPSPPPESLRSAWMRLGEATAPDADGGDVTSYTAATGGVRRPIPVEWTDDALDDLRAMQEETYAKEIELEPRGYNALLGRAVEQTMKIAMVFAICRDPSGPRVNSQDWLVAREIVGTSTNYLIWTVHNRLAGGGTRAELEQKIEEAVSRAKGEGVTRTQLARMAKGSLRALRDDAIDALVEQDRIRQMAVPGKTKPTIYYVDSRHAAAFAQKNGLTAD